MPRAVVQSRLRSPAAVAPPPRPSYSCDWRWAHGPSMRLRRACPNRIKLGIIENPARLLRVGFCEHTSPALSSSSESWEPAIAQPPLYQPVLLGCGRPLAGGVLNGGEAAGQGTAPPCESQRSTPFRPVATLSPADAGARPTDGVHCYLPQTRAADKYRTGFCLIKPC